MKTLYTITLVIVALVFATSNVQAQDVEDLGPAVTYDADQPAVTFDSQEPAVSLDSQEPAMSNDSEGQTEQQVAELTPKPPADDIGPAVNFDAMDSLVLDSSSIKGNRELPKVLYIVPWKKSDLGDQVGRPVNSLLDEILSPVDRTVFQRHLRYYNDLYNPEAVASDSE